MPYNEVLYTEFLQVDRWHFAKNVCNLLMHKFIWISLENEIQYIFVFLATKCQKLLMNLYIHY